MNLVNLANKQELVALVRCGQPDMAALLAFFDKLSSETKDSLAVADEPVRIYRLQGRAEFINDFLEAVNDAPLVLERTK